ncbi:cytidylyltransferase domain-containing protein [Shewanella algae]|uniref:cytidylyltransferase domain-containing protein n=1 Tax=Shewanella algae TaxID=38313 RepID=UPI001BEFDA32|nr:NTP transferase domain-containing protein [Shewanella algae]BCV48706.1 acylneuraminate cytidylyltransferase [Shewanella algae]
MTKTLAIVGARLNSSRLAGKHLLPLAGAPMISHIWRRLMQCQEVNDCELATTADDFNRPLLDWATEHSVECHPYEGDVNDLMARLDSIIQRQYPDYILYVCGDCPLIDPGFIDHGLKALKASGKDSIELNPGVVSMHEGMAFYSRRGWDKLMSVSQCAMSREHVGYGDKLTPILERLSIPDSGDYSKAQQRISVDTQADYRFMAEIYRRWYAEHPADSIVSLAWVQEQLLSDPALSAINAHVQQKAADRQYAKAGIYCHLGAEIGLGHFKRAELIADALQEYLAIGAQVHALYEGSTPNSLAQTSSAKVTWYQTEAEWLTALKADASPLIILDLHPDFIALPAIKQALQNLRHKGCKLVGIDKLAPLLPELDWLFIPSFNTSLQHPKVSSGWQNYLFSPLPQRPKKPQILVLTGGSDALGYGQALPGLLSQLHTDWPIVWIQGPLAPRPRLPAGCNIQVLKNPENLKQWIAESEVVLSCYGLSLFESIYARAATLLLPPRHLCDDAELALLEKTQSCLISDSLSDAIHKLELLLSDAKVRENLQTEAARVFANHGGIKQLMAEISSLLK